MDKASFRRLLLDSRNKRQYFWECKYDLLLEWRGVFEWPECAALHLEKWSLEGELSEWIMVSDWVVDACWGIYL